MDNSKINKQNKQTLPKVETLQRDRNYYLQISSQPQPQVRQNLFNIKKDLSIPLEQLKVSFCDSIFHILTYDSWCKYVIIESNYPCVMSSSSSMLREKENKSIYG